ncbi:hypothetical protein F1737_11525 [Methanoplanus sp. FWC-SCC4]|uniref:Threonyl-tRNA synthetase editing domain-containing protein n=1 Tax=Methanochimaera problematica TaxID=2609417 RepID=A0AA97I4T1_9EURY|nr:threonyl-tRNA synthetase editing domain-containing protein [Methanoplanus sp. FWC-SCC4]WOF17261.1 hypothetical protein F1737_11525 [Methanoplanus sp. FWC-SCC4]
MRIVSIHVDYMKYTAVRPTKVAEELTEKEAEMTDGVVLMSCIEKMDEINPGMVVESATANIQKRLLKIGCRRVMIYPYAHLTSSLASPDTAIMILKGLEESLKNNGLEVSRAAFGWYKEFEMKSKGHPLADLSMTICPYEGRDCDYHCPYCKSPVRKEDLLED